VATLRGVQKYSVRVAVKSLPTEVAEEEEERRKFIRQKGWLPERASAHQRWLP